MLSVPGAGRALGERRRPSLPSLLASLEQLSAQAERRPWRQGPRSHFATPARPPPLGPFVALVAPGCLCFATCPGPPSSWDGPAPLAPPSAIAVADVWRLPCEAVTVPGPGVPSPPPRQLETRSFICIYMISLCSLRDGEIYLLLSLMFDYTRRRRRAAKCTDASLGARGPEGPVTQQRVWLDAGETNSILKKADARGWKERTS